MNLFVLLLLVVIMLLPALVLLVRRHRQHFLRDDPSPITLQHLDLFQGGQLNEAAVESTKSQFRDLLERGEIDAVEASLRAGMQYVVQVRALAELGTDDAGRILERQLQKRLSDDQIEQAWYWIDLANGLRTLNRSQSLPYLLRTADQAGDIPLGHFFAAETVCFLGFTGYLRQRTTPLGRSALRVLLRAMEGLRFGLPAVVVTEARIGELVETLWDNRDEEIDPLVVRIFYEAIRLYRRSPHLSLTLVGEIVEQEAFEWQMSRLAALEPALTDYLTDAVEPLCRQLRSVPTNQHKEILQSLGELRAEAAGVVLPLLNRRDYPHANLAMEVLTWSRDPLVKTKLCEMVLENVKPLPRAMKRPRSQAPRKPSISESFPYRAILHALRGHPSPQTEALLILAARDWDPTFRAAAISSLGWWEPVEQGRVQVTLQDARRDPSLEVRQAARAALARLGERQALLWYRQMLTSEDSHRVHEAIQTIAVEGLTLLWPELDRLADVDNPEVALQAREALERMGEELERNQKIR